MMQLNLMRIYFKVKIQEHNNFTGKSYHIIVEQEDNLNGIKKEVRKFGFALQYALNDIKELKSQVGKLKKELNDARVNQLPKKVETQVQRTSEPEKKIVQSHRYMLLTIYD